MHRGGGGGGCDVDWANTKSSHNFHPILIPLPIDK